MFFSSRMFWIVRSSSTTNVYCSERSYPFGCTTGTPPPPNFFLSGQQNRRSGPAGPAKKIQKKYQKNPKELPKQSKRIYQKKIQKNLPKKSMQIYRKKSKQITKKSKQTTRKIQAHYQKNPSTTPKKSKNTVPSGPCRFTLPARCAHVRLPVFRPIAEDDESLESPP